MGLNQGHASRVAAQSRRQASLARFELLAAGKVAAVAAGGALDVADFRTELAGDLHPSSPRG